MWILMRRALLPSNQQAVASASSTIPSIRRQCQLFSRRLLSSFVNRGASPSGNLKWSAMRDSLLMWKRSETTTSKTFTRFRQIRRKGLGLTIAGSAGIYLYYATRQFINHIELMKSSNCARLISSRLIRGSLYCPRYVEKRPHSTVLLTHFSFYTFYFL